jgi:hypothetical protein
MGIHSKTLIIKGLKRNLLIKAMVIMKDNTIQKVQNKKIIFFAISCLLLLAMLFGISRMHFYQPVKITVEVKSVIIENVKVGFMNSKIFTNKYVIISC